MIVPAPRPEPIVILVVDPATPDLPMLIVFVLPLKVAPQAIETA